MLVDNANNLYSSSSDMSIIKWSDTGDKLKTLRMNQRITTITKSKSDSIIFFGSDLGEIFI